MTDAVLLAIGVVLALGLLGALAEWRMHRNREALLSWERGEHQKLIDTLTATIREAMRDAIAEAMRLERDNGKAIGALSEHVWLLDDEMTEVRKALGMERKERARQVVEVLERGIEIPKSPEGQPSTTTPDTGTEVAP